MKANSHHSFDVRSDALLCGRLPLVRGPCIGAVCAVVPRNMQLTARVAVYCVCVCCVCYVSAAATIACVLMYVQLVLSTRTNTVL